MPHAALLALWLLAGFAIGCASTSMARRYALRRQLIDQPGERRSHHAATPRGGGISIVIVLLLAAAALAVAVPGHLPSIALATGGFALVAGIGWIDDHRPLSPLLRLCVHVFAAALLSVALGLEGGGWEDMATAFVAAVVLANVWNFMDGIDGIAASQAILVAAAWALFVGEGPVLWIGLALAAGACGFLPFNFPRARIFLGDVGSGALGYALAALLALASMHRGFDGRVLLLLPLLPFLLDASLTLLARMVRGEAWWRPHVQHAYQAWARRAGSHAVVTLAYAIAALVAVLAMFAMHSWSSAVIMSTYVMFTAAGGLAWMLLRERSVRDTPDSLRDGKP